MIFLAYVLWCANEASFDHDQNCFDHADDSGIRKKPLNPIDPIDPALRKNLE